MYGSLVASYYDVIAPFNASAPDDPSLAGASVVEAVTAPSDYSGTLLHVNTFIPHAERVVVDTGVVNMMGYASGQEGAGGGLV
jgi:hypothetical protein